MLDLEKKQKTSGCLDNVTECYLKTSNITKSEAEDTINKLMVQDTIAVSCSTITSTIRSKGG